MNVFRRAVIFFIVFLLAIVEITTQVLPNSPCPDVFQYQTDPNGYVYGRISIPYDGSSDLLLGVNASMKGYYSDNNKVKLIIKMVTQGQNLIQRTTSTVNYDVRFPIQNAIPKITKIRFNQQDFCSGPPEDLIPGSPGVTSLWSGHHYYFHTLNENSPVPSFEPHIDNSNKNVYNAQDDRASSPKPEMTQIATFPPTQKVQECGVSKIKHIPLIVGGKEVSDGMFPWLAAMFTSSGNGYEYKCVANLISDRHVITAARCVNLHRLQVVKTEDILFVFGKSNLRYWATSGAVTRGASEVHTNPEFNSNSGHGDVTIITLDRPVEFSGTISPICLWEGGNELDHIINRTGTVAGWGADEIAQKNHKFSISEAKSVDMPVVSQDSCLFSNFSYLTLTSDITFCAGERDGSGTCIGDSGAGFMMVKNGKFYLRGLASLVLSDKGKCDLANFMVFCDVGKLTDWIRQFINS
ncbi:serine protease gd-like [Anthonomus grandis grandis]|uniref:serine protease gd-like n=1 Tax=Anthonomus grandis grandis TaxID=2921223 RepID=UPI0021663110|nr:serine protease gd-like [Anthonomus grandis grandis]